MKRHFFLFFLLLSLFLILSLFRASGVSAASLSPPTNPSASCPAPGTTANFSWTGVSGAGGYTVYAFDNAQRIDWSVPCGSGGRDVCTRVTGTSASASGLRPGVEYQWFVFACVGDTNNCSDPVSASFTCAASSWIPPTCTNGVFSGCTLTGEPVCNNYGDPGKGIGTKELWGTCNTICSSSDKNSFCSGNNLVNPPSRLSPPTISASPACTPTNTGSMYTISWASSSPPVTYVDISTDPNFGSWYNKDVGSTTSTSASSGFALFRGPGQPSGPPLTLKPNTTYYVRSWNGSAISGSSSFTTPNGCLPAPTNPAASCPAPGTTANFSWSGVSGAGGYTVYTFDTTVSPTIDWNQPCGSGNRTECQRVTGTSTSSSRFTAGHNYQWFVFACSGNTNNCSEPVSASFTCAAPVTVASATFNGQPLDLTGGTTLSTKLVLPSGATSVDVPIDVTDSSGSTRHLIIKFNYLSPPTNPSASCPAPGTTANFSWTGVSGAGGYTVYTFDTTVSPTIDWSIPCGSGNRTECQRVTGTSTSSSRFTAGHNYQWFVFACSGNTNNCSDPVSASFSCGATPSPPTASITGPGSGTVGQSLSFSATANGTNLKKMGIYRAPTSADFSKGSSWTPIAEKTDCNGSSSCSLNGSWTPAAGETGSWYAAVNASDASGQSCSGNPTLPSGWSDCGANDNITTTVSLTPPRPIPGDADDNSCVSNVDLAQWTKEVKGDCHRCSAWTPGTTPPTRKFAEDYNIWYDAFKNAKTLCGPAPVANCTTNVCQ